MSSGEDDDQKANDDTLPNISGTQLLHLFKKKELQPKWFLGSLSVQALRILCRHIHKVSKKGDTNCMRNTSTTSWMSAKSPPKIMFRKITPHCCQQQKDRIRGCGDRRGLVSTKHYSSLWQVKSCGGQKTFPRSPSQQDWSPRAGPRLPALPDIKLLPEFFTQAASGRLGSCLSASRRPSSPFQ